MSQRVEGRAFHASGSEKENAHSPMDVRHLGSQYTVMSAERRPCRVGLLAMVETVFTSSAFHDEQSALWCTLAIILQRITQ